MMWPWAWLQPMSRNIRSWVARRRAGTRTAAAAERAEAVRAEHADEGLGHDQGQGERGGPDA